MNPFRHLMLAFEGATVPGWLADLLAASPPAGVTLFRELNMSDPDQVSGLVAELQTANSSDQPLLVAVDQEGGQLQGLVGSTPFAGNMALGAADDPELTRRVARAMGTELRAVGINLNYAPVADVVSRPHNPSLGVRGFGGDAELVARHVAAAVSGYRDAGVLCTLKHFPGKGEARVDPHYELPRMDLDRERLDAVELPPFMAGFDAKADLLMTGHYSVPEITGDDTLPVSMSRRAIDGFVRGTLGFSGLVITDALDMGALDQGAGQVVDIIASLAGGTDLLLCTPDEALRERARMAVTRGVSRGLLDPAILDRSAARVASARDRESSDGVDPSLVGSHGGLAAELAARSVTLVRNDAGLIPLALDSDTRLLVLEPVPTNVTPADTTASYPPALAEEVRRRHPTTTGLVIPHDPVGDEIAALVGKAARHDVVIVGTVNATDGQTDLVRALARTSKTLLTIAMREPQDLARYPEVATHVASYSSHQPSLGAVVAAILGETAFQGKLPVSLPGLYPTGHGLR